MKINEFFKKTFTKDFIKEADAQYELTRQGAIMTDKKITRDEAEKARETWLTAYAFSTHSREAKDCFVVSRISDSAIIAHFPFEPPQPEYIIGDMYKFWNDNKDMWFISELKDYESGKSYPFMAGYALYQKYAEPYTLIDPAEHARLKKENAALKEVLAKQHIFVKNK